MWAKNLLFFGVCVGGFAALGSMLLNAHSPEGPRPVSKLPANDAGMQATVDAIDADFRRQWADAGLVPAQRADDLAIARRLALSLAGTIPSLEEIRALEARPPQDRIEWYAQMLLADRRSADYLAERLARAVVGVENGPFLLFRRRRFTSWLADELHAGRPYDAIVREMVAGTGLWTDNPATNFITATSMPQDGNKPDANKLAVRVSRALLGIRLDCAQCHDHPFNDRYKQRDFQSLAAFFGSTRPTLTGIRDVGGAYQVENQAGNLVTVAADVPFGHEWLPEHGTPRARLAAWITHPENTAFAQATVNRIWALMLGRPLVEPVDDLPLDGATPAALRILADDFAVHGYNLRHLIVTIARTEAFQLDSASPDNALTPDHQQAWAAFGLTRLRPEQVVGSVLQAASLTTLDYQSHILVRIAKAIGQQQFINRYGDTGQDELEPAGGTIPQRLLLLNGNLVQDKTRDNLLGNAASRIAALAPDDATAIDTAYLAVLTRHPTPPEAAHFAHKLADTRGKKRTAALGDLYWTLINSTEFSWIH